MKIDVNQLCRFLANPAKFLLNERLGIYLNEDEALFDETEPFEVKGLEKYGLEQELVERMFQKGMLKDSFPAIRASGQLPHGVPGELFFGRPAGASNHLLNASPLTEKETLLDPSRSRTAIR